MIQNMGSLVGFGLDKTQSSLKSPMLYALASYGSMDTTYLILPHLLVVSGTPALAEKEALAAFGLIWRQHDDSSSRTKNSQTLRGW